MFMADVKDDKSSGFSEFTGGLLSEMWAISGVWLEEIVKGLT